MRITIFILMLSSFVFAQRPEQMQAAQQMAQHAKISAQDQAVAGAMLKNSRVTPKPRFSPKPGVFLGSVPPVAITVNEKGAAIYFTTDGSTPTIQSQRYTGPISMSATTTLKAIAIAPSFAQSGTVSGKYVLK
jgi:Chitobiase/beta-hexosaminidase C-terminal domain